VSDGRSEIRRSEAKIKERLKIIEQDPELFLLKQDIDFIEDMIEFHCIELTKKQKELTQKLNEKIT